MKVTLDQIKELRMKTGVGIHQVKEALDYSGGDVEKAILFLREKGLAKATKREGNVTAYGIIGSYIHADGSLGAIVEVNSETDFAAKNEKFQELANNIAIHIAASDPQYLEISDIPVDIIDKEKQVYRTELQGKPKDIQEKILKGKLEKFYEDVVLMEQKYVKDDSKKIKDLINDTVAALAEKIKVSKFSRIKVAGGSGSCGLTLDN